LTSTTSPGERRDFQLRLLAVREDPQVTNIARWRAGDPDIAEDALQEAFYAIAKTKDPERISDLRAYFIRVLAHEIYRLHGQSKATTLVDDFAALADARQTKLSGQPAATPVSDTVTRELLTQVWRERFAAQRADLVRRVPGRSRDQGRYRDLIVTIAQQVLMSLVNGDVSDADANSVFCAAYPEWFADSGCTVDNAQQRLSRARADVTGVLRIVVDRTDLYA
jgi:DNA-directed RNA polymerase specialized sigma24 family protein